MIHDLKRQRVLVSAIALRVGCDRKTVRNYLERGREAPVYDPRAPKPRLLEPFEGLSASAGCPVSGTFPASAGCARSATWAIGYFRETWW